MHKKGLEIYKEYAGVAAVEKFLANFAPSNPELANLTVEFVYGNLIASSVLPHQQKAALVICSCIGMGNAPSALAFHSEAFSYNGGTVECLLELNAIGESARQPWQRATDFIHPNIGEELSILCAIAATTALGAPAIHNLTLALTTATQRQITKEKILYAINLIAGYAGFPAAISASAKYQSLVQELTTK